MIKKLLIIVSVCLLVLACEKTTKPQEKVATPVIESELESPFFSAPQTIEISCATSSATIRYTLDGTEPISTSTLYSSDFEISNSTTVKARAFKSGMKQSDIASESYAFQVSAIAVYPESGTYLTPQTITFQTITPGTVIHYTTDGSEPTESSDTYTPPLVINATTTLKAKGFKAGWNPTVTVTKEYSFNVASIYISPLGGTYTSPQTITITPVTAGTEIHYTTDGSEPTETSATYTAPFIIDGNITLKAKGFLSGWNPSETKTETYVFNATPPSFSIAAGTFNSSFNLTITTPTSNGSIVYTTDGTEPTESSNLYTSPININVSTTIKAKTIKANWNSSTTATANYVLKVPSPVFNPIPGTYIAPQDVAISCSAPGVTIYYTTDGSSPTTNSDLYTAPLTLTSSTTIKAIASKTGWTVSNISTGVYTVNQTQTVATPAFSPAAGTFTAPQSITISCATIGATIRYTTDNSEPDTFSDEYTTPINIGVSTVIKAKAFKLGYFDSQTATANYTINFTLGQMVNVSGGTFTMGRTSGNGEADETPPHQVTLTAFSIGKYEVTQMEWLTIMGSNPSYHTGNLYKPVETINWYAALVYCNKLSILQSLTPVYSISGSTNPDDWGAIPTVFDATWNAAVCNWSATGYRLPTEAEWEYAARGATNNPDYLYAGSDNANTVAWYQDNAGGTSHIIGHLQPNGLGIYDMSGNVYEWCWDWYDTTYYGESPQNSPTGPADGIWRATRGGSWDSYAAQLCRVVDRLGKVPTHVEAIHGFRVARTIN